MTVPVLAPGQVDVGGVATAVIDVLPPGSAAAPPVLLLHGSGPGVTAIANWRREPEQRFTSAIALRRSSTSFRSTMVT